MLWGGGGAATLKEVLHLVYNPCKLLRGISKVSGSLGLCAMQEDHIWWEGPAKGHTWLPENISVLLLGVLSSDASSGRSLRRRSYWLSDGGVLMMHKRSDNSTKGPASVGPIYSAERSPNRSPTPFLP